MLTQAQYEVERAICDKAMAYWKANATFNRGGSSSMSAELCAHPDYAACDNAMRGRIEVFETMRDKPNKLFAYYGPCERGEHNVTTWTGDILGVAKCGNLWRDNFGGSRQAFTVKIGGTQYHGVAYLSSGDYCRLTKSKAA